MITSLRNSSLLKLSIQAWHRSLVHIPFSTNIQYFKFSSLFSVVINLHIHFKIDKRTGHRTYVEELLDRSSEDKP